MYFNGYFYINLTVKLTCDLFVCKIDRYIKRREKREVELGRQVNCEQLTIF